MEMRAGVATIGITPAIGFARAEYGARERPSEGIAALGEHRGGKDGPA
jgi:hypothetical protein